jgi:hypothetical protein
MRTNRLLLISRFSLDNTRPKLLQLSQNLPENVQLIFLSSCHPLLHCCAPRHTEHKNIPCLSLCHCCAEPPVSSLRVFPMSDLRCRPYMRRTSSQYSLRPQDSGDWKRCYVQNKWMTPFLKMEAEALLAAGYLDIGWREVSTEAIDIPNAKVHIFLVSTSGTSALVDCCLFSTVCSTVSC